MPPSMDKTALSYWFPMLEAAGLPVPKTVIVDMPEPAKRSMIAAFDGQDAGDPKPFFTMIDEAARQVGYPCFLRTDHTSGKHDWEDTCFLRDQGSIPRNVFGIVEYSEMAGLIGLPWDRWAVREFLPVKPFGICEAFGRMPVCREFRFFVDDGDVQCWHPYWPAHALEQGRAPADLDYDRLCATDDAAELKLLASAAGKAVGGSWSIDLLETERGWFITDMAEAHKSFHWEGCPYAA